MKVERFVNSIFTSNSYILYSDKSESAYIIDPGDSIPIINWLIKNKKVLKGIFITHSHFDHIYGINDLVAKFPSINIFASFYAKEGMASEKLNGSLYHEKPYVVKKKDIILIKEGDQFKLWEDILLNVIETPGHNRDCLSFYLDKNLFTGDAFIPGIKVVTKIKFGDKTQAGNSIKRLFEQFNDDTMIWPGHEINCLFSDIKHDKY
jgi:glyoxylase-like metal-dependent hydrolase (beta-lactamase superfamily II)